MEEIKKLKSVRLKYMHDCLNAGDQFSFVLAKRYFSENVISCSRAPLTVPNLIFVGSFLRNTDKYSHICGAGCISSDPQIFKLPAAPKAIHCLRGPMTAELLENRYGIQSPKIYADPGILAPELFPRQIPAIHKIGIVPHHVDANVPWIELCRKKGIPIIDVLSPLDTYFSEMHRCEIILSSSLHGVIFAHAYGIPALWIELSSNVIGNGFKFYDYYLSIGVEPDQVNRVRVIDDTDPYEIAGLATGGDQSMLIAPLKDAIYNAIEQLRIDQRRSTLRNIVLPFSAHNRKTAIEKITRFNKKIKWYQDLKKNLRSKNILKP